MLDAYSLYDLLWRYFVIPIQLDSYNSNDSWLCRGIIVTEPNRACKLVSSVSKMLLTNDDNIEITLAYINNSGTTLFIIAWHSVILSIISIVHMNFSFSFAPDGIFCMMSRPHLLVTSFIVDYKFQKRVWINVKRGIRLIHNLSHKLFWSIVALYMCKMATRNCLSSGFVLAQLTEISHFRYSIVRNVVAISHALMMSFGCGLHWISYHHACRVQNWLHDIAKQ